MTDNIRIANEMAACAKLAEDHGQLFAADRLLDLACELDPENSAYCTSRGLSKLRLGNVRLAGKCLARSLKLSPDNFSEWNNLFYTLRTTKQWDLLSKSCNRALKSGYRPAEVYMDLGTALFHLGDRTQAEIAFQKSIAMTGEYRKIYSKLLQNGIANFNARKITLDFLLTNEQAIREKISIASADKYEPADHKIFVYWGQGFDSAPELVKACYSQLTKNNSNVISIDNSNVDKYIEIPDYIKHNSHISMAHRSDVIRICLLARHGGVWIDATGYCIENLGHFFDSVGSDFFAYRSGDNQISNWFLCSRSNSYISQAMATALLHHWSVHEKALDNFVFHHIFEGLTLIDSKFADYWNQVPNISRSPALKLARQLGNSYNEKVVDPILRASAVHKLTHKYSRKYKEQPFGPDSILNMIINGTVSTMIDGWKSDRD